MGTPTVTLAQTTYTVKVTDQTTPTAPTSSKTFQLTVNGAVTATQSIASKVLTQNVAVPFTPVTGGGGTSPLTYGVSPALPAGLTFNTGSGQITGTPTATIAATNFTVTITDTNRGTASAGFSLTVNGAVTATQSITSKVLTQNVAAAPFTPVTGGGGTSPLTYGVSPALPAGLTFNTGSGQITGTPTATMAATNFTVTVSDANGGTASNTFQLTVNGAVTATQAVASVTLTQNGAVIPVTPVTGSGGSAPLTYGVSPALPAGLVFNTANGQITGTPTVTHVTSTFTVTVTDANGSAASNTFQLTINATPPAVTSISPTSGPAAGGTAVTITGSNFVSGHSYTASFGGTVVAAAYASATTLTATTPSGSGTATLTVTDTTSATAATGSTTFSYVDTQGIAAKAIGGFISDRANQIVSNLFDMNSGIDRLNDAAAHAGGNSGGGNGGGSGFAGDETGVGPGFGLPPLARSFGPRGAAFNGTVIPPAGLASASGTGAMQDFYGLKAMLYGTMQNAGQSGDMDRFNYAGAFNATVNAHEGFAATFHTSVSQIMKWQANLDRQQAASMGVGTSRGSSGSFYSPLDVWLEGTYAGYGGNRIGQFGLFTVGSDYVVNPNLLLGVFTQVDTMNQTSGTALAGTGWMAGPYATVRLDDQLFWNARAAWGRSGNTLSGSGDFTSTRWLASSELSGRWKLGRGFTVTPNFGFTYFQDYTDAYMDTFGVTIPAVKTELGQLKLSPQLAYGFATDKGTWIEPSITPELIWNFASTNVDGLGVLPDTASGPAGLRGRLKAGMTIRTPRGASISAFGSYDGIGIAGYSAIATQAQVVLPLN